MAIILETIVSSDAEVIIEQVNNQLTPYRAALHVWACAEDVNKISHCIAAAWFRFWQAGHFLSGGERQTAMGGWKLRFILVVQINEACLDNGD